MAGESSKTQNEASGDRQSTVEKPDLLLDSPQLKAEKIRLDFAKVLSLEINGLEAELRLEANLEGIVSVLEELVEVVGENPAIIRSLLETIQRSLETVEEVVEADADRGTVRRIVDEDGDIIRSTLDENGRVLSEELVGERETVEATEAAERQAEELNVDIRNINGTGERGRVLVGDVTREAGGG